MNFQRLNDNDRFNLYYLPTRKFKTSTIRVFFKGSLTRNVESQAILPFLLKRGSEKYPSLMDISRRLENLYGSTLSMDISKMGEMQVFLASMDVVNGRFIAGETDLLFNAIDLFNDLLLHPNLDDGHFPLDRFDQEKTNLARHVKSIIDDKGFYTHMRLIQEMFKDEPYSQYEWGDIDPILALDRDEVLGFYRDFLATAQVDVYVVGRLSGDEEKKLAERLLPFAERRGIQAVEPLDMSVAADGETIVEEQAVEQSKLEMGFRVSLDQGSDSIYAMVLYNAILGGGSFSKLFKRVREEASLAYYISSAFDKLKGFFYVTAGINADRLDEAMKRIRACMDEIADGEITDDEIGNAKKSILNGLRSISDSPYQMIDFNHIAQSAGLETSTTAIAGIIEGLGKEQVSAVSRQIVPGKTFFLKALGP